MLTITVLSRGRMGRPRRAKAKRRDLLAGTVPLAKLRTRREIEFARLEQETTPERAAGAPIKAVKSRFGAACRTCSTDRQDQRQGTRRMEGKTRRCVPSVSGHDLFSRPEFWAVSPSGQHSRHQVHPPLEIEMSKIGLGKGDASAEACFFVGTPRGGRASI